MWRKDVRLAVVAISCVVLGSAASAEDAVISGLMPKDAGLRYGQALGVLEVCYGSKLTEKAKSLGQAFKDSDLETFKAAAASVYNAWVKVRNCANQRDPNTCKVIMDKSCLAAEAEIGPSGTALPGLVEFLKHE